MLELTKKDPFLGKERKHPPMFEQHLAYWFPVGLEYGLFFVLAEKGFGYEKRKKAVYRDVALLPTCLDFPGIYKIAKPLDLSTIATVQPVFTENKLENIFMEYYLDAKKDDGYETVYSPVLPVGKEELAMILENCSLLGEVVTDKITEKAASEKALAGLLMGYAGSSGDNTHWSAWRLAGLPGAIHWQFNYHRSKILIPDHLGYGGLKRTNERHNKNRRLRNLVNDMYEKTLMMGYSEKTQDVLGL
jgi:hypothetical protein